jgi:hypothetical protein
MGTGPSLAARWDDAVRTRQAILSATVFDNPSRVVVRVNSPSGREIVSMARQAAAIQALPPALPGPQSLGRRAADAGRPLAGLVIIAVLTLSLAVWVFPRAR